MDLSYTPDEEAFRARVRSWLEANVPDTSSGYDLAAMKAWLELARFIAPGPAPAVQRL